MDFERKTGLFDSEKGDRRVPLLAQNGHHLDGPSP